MKIFGFNITRDAGAKAAHSIQQPPEVRASPENPRYSLDDPAVLGALGLADGSKAPAITPSRAMQTSAVFACVRVLAESFAQLPVKVLERDGKGGAREVASIPLAGVLGLEANSYQSAYQFRETAQAHRALWGNAYAEIQRNKMGEVVGLYPLNPWDCTPRLVGTAKVYDVNGIRLRDDEVLHIPALGCDGFCGISPISQHRTSIGMALAAEEFGERFYRNGTKLSGTLEHPHKLGDQAARRLRENWQQVYAGASNAGRVAVLEEGMKFAPLMMPLEDAQYIESRKFQISDIARIFRVPPHKIGDLERATFSNIEQQSIDFVTDSVMPGVICWEQELARKCLPKGGRYFVKFNLAGLLRGDTASRYAAYTMGRTGGWLNADDIRDLEDLPPLPDGRGKGYLEPLNMRPAGDPTQAKGAA